MKKKEIKAASSIRTLDEQYNKAYGCYVERINAQSIEIRNLAGRMSDIVCTIREASIYLNQYGELIPPKLANVMRQRIKAMKKLGVDCFREITKEQ